MSEFHEVDGLPIVVFPTPAQWREWLDRNHAEAAGLWLKIAKKASGIATVNYGEALDHALCFGWIDGQKRAYDSDYFLQRFTPRRPKSIWSRINVDKVAVLTSAGLMQPAGQAAVDAAKEDGRWEAAYPSQAVAKVPPDLQAAFDESPVAAQFFDTLTSAQRYSFLYRIHEAKRPETRTRRIEKYVEMLAQGQKLT